MSCSAGERIKSVATARKGRHQTHHRGYCIAHLWGEPDEHFFGNGRIQAIHSRKLPAKAELLSASNSTEK
jgi:hypothetical protein